MTKNVSNQNKMIRIESTLCVLGALLTGCVESEATDDGWDVELPQFAEEGQEISSPSLVFEPGSDGNDRPSMPESMAESARSQSFIPGFELWIAIEGDDIELSWEEQPGFDYEVWRGGTPYFAIGDPGTVLLANQEIEMFIDPWVGSSPSNYYYRVRAVAPDETTNDSTTVGKEVFFLETGYNNLGLSLINDVDTAAELLGSVGSSAISAHRWEETTQSWIWSWATDVPPGITFSLGQSVSLSVDASHPEQIALTGHVSTPTDVSLLLVPGLNIVTLMPSSVAYSMASELLAALPGATGVGRWNASAQATEMYMGPADEDFALESGTHIKIETDQASGWPPPCNENTDCASNLLCADSGQCELDPCVFDVPGVECVLHEVEIELTADNSWSGTFDGAPFSGPNALDWTGIDTVTFSVPGGAHTIGVQAYDAGTIGGFIAVVRVDGEIVSGTGDGIWTLGGGGAAGVCGNLGIWGGAPNALYAQGATWIWDDSACTPFHNPYFELSLEI